VLRYICAVFVIIAALAGGGGGGGGGGESPPRTGTSQPALASARSAAEPPGPTPMPLALRAMARCSAPLARIPLALLGERNSVQTPRV